jgi:hypothetical protein
MIFNKIKTEYKAPINGFIDTLGILAVANENGELVGIKETRQKPLYLHKAEKLKTGYWLVSFVATGHPCSMGIDDDKFQHFMNVKAPRIYFY